MKVIYMGLPLRLCSDDLCNCVFGFWSWVMEVVPFNGIFMVYTSSYLPALWHWLSATQSDDDD
jgi:hypothetical protein